MTVSNYKDLLTEGLAVPLAFEARFPNAPKLSTQLTTVTSKLPTAPNFFTTLPDLPTLPTLPKLGITLPGGGPLGGGSLPMPKRTIITGVTESYNPLPTKVMSPDVNFLQRKSSVVSGSETFNYK